MKVGVLALQGDVPEHQRALAALVGRKEVTAVRQPEDLEDLGALLLPGGESTTIAKLLQDNRLWGPLQSRLAEGLPVLGTCAGLVLLANHLEPSAGGLDPPTFGVLDVHVRRNDYGTQRESFEGPVEVLGLEGAPFPGVFIRAPRILATGSGVSVLARQGGEVVGVRSGPVWGLTFHPELSGDPRLVAMFLEEAARLNALVHPKKRTSAATVRPRPSRTSSQ